MTDYLALAKDAYDTSTRWIETNWREDWDYSLRAFRLEHPPGSKYLSDEYKARSKLVSPKTRSIIRKNEAAGAVALFSNMDIVNVEPGNPDDPMSVASSAAMKAILEYRLGKTIPTFEICMGGIQDAQAQGAVVSYQYWEYEVRDGRKIKDKPCIELRPIENIRLDAGASWLDPIGTSPYFCDIIPMYVCDVRAMMNSKDAKTGRPKWKTLKDDIIGRAKPDVMNTTRDARLGKSQDPHREQHAIKSFDTVWVMRWFMKNSTGKDQVFYTMGTEDLLTEVKPIEEVYFHGKRPYEMGYAILETHKVMKTSVPTLVKPIHLESTDLRNQRLDNVKFVLNPRWIVARGRQVDTQSLVRNVPGGVTMATDPKNDVKGHKWDDVTSSSYVEHDRLNAEFDDLAGNFSPNTKVSNNAVNDTLGGSRLAMQSAGIMTDYLLRTITETWWEKVLRQLVLLEAYYETDENVLAVCAQKARLFPRFGLSSITDDMLMAENTLTVNVGFGASDPAQQLQKFVLVTKEAIAMVSTAPSGFNIAEAIKELYSKAGYRDGARFFNGQQDPRLVKAMEMVQQLQQALNGKGLELQADMQVAQLKIGSSERISYGEQQIDTMRIQGDLAIRKAELILEDKRLELEQLKLQAELQGASEEHRMKLIELNTGIEEAQLKLEGERQKLHGQSLKLAQELERGQQDLANARAASQNENKISGVADGVSQSMQSIGMEIQAINKGLGEAKASIDGLSDVKESVRHLGDGLALVMGNLQGKKKPSGFRLKKDGKKTKAVTVEYEDGSADEIQVS